MLVGSAGQEGGQGTAGWLVSVMLGASAGLTWLGDRDQRGAATLTVRLLGWGDCKGVLSWDSQLGHPHPLPMQLGLLCSVGPQCQAFPAVAQSSTLDTTWPPGTQPQKSPSMASATLC